MRRITLGVDPWEYCARGDGPRGLLVLGPALTFADSPQRFFALFEGNRRVIAPTLPPVSRAWEVVDGLARLLDLEGLEQVDVFGQGLGAGFAHLFVRRHPDRVERLALADFGLMTRTRAATLRAVVEMFERMPYGSVRQHCAAHFHRHAEVLGDPHCAAELLKHSERLLERHTRETALRQLKLQADLFRGDDDYLLGRPMATRALLLFANADPCFTSAEQQALVQSYPSAEVHRTPQAARLIGLQSAPEPEALLTRFFPALRVVQTQATPAPESVHAGTAHA